MNGLGTTGFSLQRGSAHAEFTRVTPAIIVDGKLLRLPAEPSYDRSTPAGRELRWSVSAAGASGDLECAMVISSPENSGEAFVASRITNRAAAPVRLDFFRPIDLRAEMGGHLLLGPDGRRLKVFVMTPHTASYGTRVEELSVDLRDVEHAIRDRTSGVVSHGLVALHVPEGPSLVAGSLDFRAQDSTFSILHGYAGGTAEGQIREFTAELEHLKDIQPGQTLELAPIWLAVGDDPLELLERYAQRVRQQMNITLNRPPPCGWISWYAYRVAMTEDIVRDNAQVIRRSGMFDLGGTLCHMDLGWNRDDRPGDWLEGNDRFPGGIDNLCRQLAADGFQVALWSAPLVVSENSETYRRHPDWILRDARGEPVNMGTWWWHPVESFYGLDPTLPAVHEHLHRVYRTLRSWGATAFKTDFALGVWPGAGNDDPDAARLPIRYADPSYTRLEACRKVFSTIRSAIGPDAHLTACNFPWQGVIGIADSIFLANDIGNLTHAESSDERPQRRRWDHFEARTRQVFARYFFHDQIWLGNPDCFVAENEARENHARARLQVVMLAGGQYKCSNQLPSWKPQRMAAFLRGLPWYGKAARPIDLFESHTPSILHLPIEASWGRWHVVGLFNWDSAESEKRIDFARLSPQAASGPQLVWDFWDERLIGDEHAGSATVRLPGESATMVAIRPRPTHPSVLASNMHFTMGAMEIVEHRWDEQACVLRGRARRCPGARGDLFIYVPAGYAHPQATALPAGASVLRLPLHFETFDCDWQATFVRRS